jgi:predicted aldo/keto reductase-like oxidoreductase
MNYRRLGKTGLMVSEIGLGAEWLERHDARECKAVIDRCAEQGINILDCWMSEPNVRSNIGAALRGQREKWIIQGHVGATWQNGQHVLSRDIDKVRPAFEDLLARLGTDYIDLGMIHCIDRLSELDEVVNGPVYQYMLDLREKGVIRHIGLSTHNPELARRAVETGVVEMIMFSINPAFDMLPPTDNVDDYFSGKYDEKLGGIDASRAALYQLCEQHDVGITVMKSFAGGYLFKAETSPFGVGLTPVQCLHYALTRPGVACVLAGVESPEQVDAAVAYETASADEKDYATVLAGAPHHAYGGQCTYCGHCRPCSRNIDVAMVNKLYDLAVMQEQTPASLREHYRSLEHTAGECIGCGSCEERCPFGVNIVERMKKADALLG